MAVPHNDQGKRRAAADKRYSLALIGNPNMRQLIASTVLLLSLSALAAETPLAIPTDAKARYLVLEVGGTWPSRTIVTTRVGPSGTSYSKRLYDCASYTAKYLGTGDSLAEMSRSRPDPRMAPIVPESIPD